MDNSGEYKKKKAESTSVASLADKQKQYDSFIAQCKAEYEYCFKSQSNKKEIWKNRLVIYNNQKRDIKRVGDNTMYTIMQSMLAYLYDDKYGVMWSSGSDGDSNPIGENLTKVCEYDYTEMEKYKIDYFLLWDVLFFGRGFVEVYEFERDRKEKVFIPCPRNISPMDLWFDPNAKSVNGIGRKRVGSAKFIGYELGMTRPEMEDMEDGVFFKLDFRMIKPSNTADKDQREDHQSESRGYTPDSSGKGQSSLGLNARYNLVKWYTYMNGKRVCAFFTEGMKLLLGYVELKRDYFNIADRSLAPDSVGWDVTSIPDITEDKQRMKAIIKNLTLDHLKQSVLPPMLYDPERISSKHELDMSDNKAIPVTGGGDVRAAMQPAVTPQINYQIVNFMLDEIEMSAQKGSGVPDMKQGVLNSASRTASEVNLAQSGSDQRNGLLIKMGMWYEYSFWNMCYDMYADYFADDIDEKVLMLSSMSYVAPVFKFKKNEFISDVRPKLKIESLSSSRARQVEEFRALTQTLAFAMQNPNSDKDYTQRYLMQVAGLPREITEQIIPKTTDERIAEEENLLLASDDSKKPMPIVKPQDNHNVHLRVHNNGKDTPRMRVHIATHIEALAQIKANPSLVPQQQLQEQQMGGQDSTDLMGKILGGSSGAVQPSDTSASPTRQTAVA